MEKKFESGGFKLVFSEENGKYVIRIFYNDRLIGVEESDKKLNANVIYGKIKNKIIRATEYSKRKGTSELDEFLESLSDSRSR